MIKKFRIYCNSKRGCSSLKDLFEKLKASYKEEFEDTFSLIMKKIYKDAYQPVQAYGNIGDRKVDGILNGNTIFAVHAPEVFKEVDVLDKIKSDFTGFIDHQNQGNWPDSIEKWIFVIKTNREKGTPPNIVKFIMDLQEEYDIETSIWTLDDIRVLIEHKFTPEIPFEKISKIISKISNIKKMYVFLRDEYDKLDRNSNRLLNQIEAENNIIRMHYFISLYKDVVDLSEIRDEYHLKTAFGI
jgi:hypothetical protein